MTTDFVAILPAPHLIHHYRQLAYISGDDRPVWLTQVDGAEVTDILKWTSDGFIYYMSTLPNLPGTRHLFRIQFRTPQNSIGSGRKQQPECVSCNRTMENLGQSFISIHINLKRSKSCFAFNPLLNATREFR